MKWKYLMSFRRSLTLSAMSIFDFSLDVIQFVKLSSLQTQKFHSLQIIIQLRIPLIVFRLRDEFLESFSGTFESSDLFMHNILVNLEIDDLELRLTLHEVENLEVFLIEFCQSLELKQWQNLHCSLVWLNDFYDGKETKNSTDELLEGPDKLQEEHEERFCRSLSMQSLLETHIQCWWRFISRRQLCCLHK